MDIFQHFSAAFLIGTITLGGATDLVANESEVVWIVGDRRPQEGGDFEPGRSPLESPFGVDFDSSGTMYIIELGGNRVHRLVPGEQLETMNENATKGYVGDGGPIKQARFDGMHNCVVTADDQLLIADSWNHCVRQVDLKSGIVTTIAGTGKSGFSGDGGPARAATFDYLMCIALDPTKSKLHMADLKNLRIREMDLASGIVRTIAGNGQKGVPVDGAVATAAPLVDPRAVAADSSGHVYILERNGNVLRVVRPDGTIHTLAGSGERGFRDGPGMQAQFGAPKHLCCDPAGNVYIADDTNRAIRKYDPRTGEVTTLLGRGFGDAQIMLEHPHGVRWHEGKLYVVDTGHHRILRLP